MRASLVFLFGLSLIGCATSMDSEQPINAGPSITSDKKVDEKLNPTGNTFAFRIREEYNAVLSKDETEQLRSMALAFMEKNGFKLVDKEADAFVTVSIASDRIPELTSDNTKVSTNTVVFKDGQFTENFVSSDAPVYRFALVIFINEYARRPREWIRINFQSPKPLPVIPADIYKSVEDQLATLKLNPPPTNVKMAGKPGCVPRFGYEDRSFRDRNIKLGKVTMIYKGSPAAKAGIQVGDVIEAIDSKSYEEWNLSEQVDVYEKRETVPMKINRNGKTVRTNIRADLMCL